jgi:hypothetical protein
MDEWDSRKAAANLSKHGVPFLFAARVFDDPQRIQSDVSNERDGEQRQKCIGMIDGKMFAVVFTWRGDNRRIISARRTNAKEERQYASASNP